VKNTFGRTEKERHPAIAGVCRKREPACRCVTPRNSAASCSAHMKSTIGMVAVTETQV